MKKLISASILAASLVASAGFAQSGQVGSALSGGAMAPVFNVIADLSGSTQLGGVYAESVTFDFDKNSHQLTQTVVKFHGNVPAAKLNQGLIAASNSVNSALGADLTAVRNNKMFVIDPTRASNGIFGLGWDTVLAGAGSTIITFTPTKDDVPASISKALLAAKQNS